MSWSQLVVRLLTTYPVGFVETTQVGGATDGSN